MKIFYDTEFLEDGKTIELISIGMVTETGKEYYAINDDMPYDRIVEDDWIMNNVIAKLGHGRKIPKEQIRDEVEEFIKSAHPAELWAWYGSYDHVALAQLWGKMIDLPSQWVPMWTNDLRQEVLRHAPNISLPYQANGLHNALDDAKHLKLRYDYLKNRGLIK